MNLLVVVESPECVEYATRLFWEFGVEGDDIKPVLQESPKTKPSMKALRALTRPFEGYDIIMALGDTAARYVLDQSNVQISKLRGRNLGPEGKIRVSYGIEKILQEGYYYHKEHVINDLRLLVAPIYPGPVKGYLPQGKMAAVDTEYDKSGALLNVCFADDTCGTESRVMPYDWLIGHNIPGDIDQLAKSGFAVKEDWYKGKKILDSYLLAKMVDENKPKGSYGVEQLMLTEYNTLPWKEATDKKFKETGDAADWTPEEREERCRLDAWASYMLARKYYPELKEAGCSPLLIETIHRISMTLYRVGLAGAKVDLEYLEQFKQTNKREMATHEMVIKANANSSGWDLPEPFCPTKDDDIRHLMFDILEQKPVTMTASGKPAVDKVSLKQYPRYKSIVDEILAYNKYQKLDSVYGDIDRLFDKNGFIHFWVQQLGARTGRRSGKMEEGPSSTNPQNWPPAAKGMIVSRFKGGKIGAFDYQSLEPVLYAWISQDSNLYEFFYNGRGYLDVCKQVLGKDIEKTDKIYRAIKSMTLGIFYNMQDYKMSMQLWNGVMMEEPVRFSADFKEHKKQVGEYRKQILKLFPGLVRYMERQKLALARDHQITAPDGFIRHLPHEGPECEGYWRLVNQAINFPVQHMASMVTGCALVDCEEAILQEEKVYYRDWHKGLHELDMPPSFSILINEVHDELTWDFHPHTLYRDREIILEVMKRPPSLTKLIPGFNINLKIEPTITERWGQKA